MVRNSWIMNKTIRFRKLFWPHWKYYPSICPSELREVRKLIYGNHCPAQASNEEPPDTSEALQHRNRTLHNEVASSMPPRCRLATIHSSSNEISTAIRLTMANTIMSIFCCVSCQLTIHFLCLSIKIHVNLSYQQPIFSPINSIQFFPPWSSHPKHNYTKCPRP
jgi:hypothetical protein